MSENPIGYVQEGSDDLTRSNYEATLIGSFQYPGFSNTWFQVYDGYPSSTNGSFRNMTVIEGCTRVGEDGMDQRNELYASLHNLIPESTYMIDETDSLPYWATCEYVRRKSCETFTSEVIRLYNNSLDLPMVSSLNVSEEEKVDIRRQLWSIWCALRKAIGSMPGPPPAVGSTEAWITERLLLAIRKSARLIPTMTDGRHALGSSTSQRHLAGLKVFYQQEMAKASTVWNSNQGMYVAL